MTPQDLTLGLMMVAFCGLLGIMVRGFEEFQEVKAKNPRSGEGEE